MDLTVLDSPVPAELLLQASRPALVVGCSSAALFTASALYGFPVVRVGTERLLARLTPYDHPHRVALVLAEAVLPGAGPEHGTTVPGAGAGARRPEGRRRRTWSGKVRACRRPRRGVAAKRLRVHGTATGTRRRTRGTATRTCRCGTSRVICWPRSPSPCGRGCTRR
ncbi:polysialyltransferase family glycosyltransferase [Streptomyces albogriseolus]